jgi:hypothetical protein
MFRIAAPYPVAPGKTEADIRSIAAYFEAHPTQHRESRQRLGITVERVYLQATPMGNLSLATRSRSVPLARWSKRCSPRTSRSITSSSR